MILLLSGGAAAVVYRLLRTRVAGRTAQLAAAGAALLVWQPVPGLLVAAAAGALGGRRTLVDRRRARARAGSDVAALGDLLLMGLSAGLSLRSGLESAAADLGGPIGGEVEGVIRASAGIGLAAALAGSSGFARRLYVLLARAQMTGASTTGAVAAFVDEQRAAERSRRLEAARRLPVRLMVPLALLILPGFVVLSIGPAVLDAMQRLAGPVLP